MERQRAPCGNQPHTSHIYFIHGTQHTEVFALRARASNSLTFHATLPYTMFVFTLNFYTNIRMMFLSLSVVCSLYKIFIFFFSSFFSFQIAIITSHSRVLSPFFILYSFDRSIVSMTWFGIESTLTERKSRMINAKKQFTRLKYLCWHFTCTHLYENTHEFKTTEQLIDLHFEYA